MGKISVIAPAMQQKLSQYLVAGRLLPTEKDSNPPAYRMKIYARNSVVAKSRFWYFMRKLQRVKKANGQILECKKVHERCGKVKNYAIWLRYDSRTGTHNMYKEYRDISSVGAVSRMYAEMAGRHRARGASLQIIKIATIKDDQCRRPHITQLLDENLKFPHTERKLLAPKETRQVFAYKRPTTYYA
eukprot:Blabericola_migrator_1__8125@NODE_4191_length_1286_cov_235_509434_g2596_i0_p1_GENE_NODE_4191_length_1286_cov_235_509434_g2596_i0NODE_4191_length_1286_cov_235_509434_g2596_i0_p1_ORF_typecomplete_len212_score40_05Ribosomal_L18A/PF01775_17/1_1e48_NODE_4191_length_1286_cov_235_509434_g2596_i078638